MSDSHKKRTLDAFFKPPPKKPRISDNGEASKPEMDNVEVHVSYVEQLYVSKSNCPRYCPVMQHILFQYHTSQNLSQRSWPLFHPQLGGKSKISSISISSTSNPLFPSILNDKSSNSFARNCHSTE
jgi:hypothetical protein